MLAARLYRFIQTVGIHHFTKRRKSLHQLPVIHPHTNQHFHLLFHQRKQDTVIVSLIRSSGNPNHRSRHAVQSIPGRIHIRRLGIIDIHNPLLLRYRLQSVLHLRKTLQSPADSIISQSHPHASQNSRHSIVYIMPALDADVRLVYRKAPAFPLHYHHIPLHVCPILQQVWSIRKTRTLRSRLHSVHSLPYHITIPAIYKHPVGIHILQNPELGIGIIFKLMVIAVQVVGRNIGNHRHIRFKTGHAVQLETRQLHHIHRMCILRHLCSQTLSDIPCQPGIHPCLRQNMMREQSRRRFPVTSGNTNHPGTGIPPGKLNLRNHLRTAFP